MSSGILVGSAHAWGPASQPRTHSAATQEEHAQSLLLPDVRFSWLNVYNRWIGFASLFMSNRRQRWAAMRSAFVKNPLSVSPELNAGSADRNSLDGGWGCRSGLPTFSANAESLAPIRAHTPRLLLPPSREKGGPVCAPLRQAFTRVSTRSPLHRERQLGTRGSRRL